MLNAVAAGHALTFERRVFKGAAIWGVLVLLPMYLAEPMYAWLGRPPVTHPEHLYGFVGGALVAQLFYWTIGADPLRHRVFMPLAVLAKLAFFVPVAVLFALARTDVPTFFFASVDLVLGFLFFVAWRRTPVEAPSRHELLHPPLRPAAAADPVDGSPSQGLYDAAVAKRGLGRRPISAGKPR